MRRSLSAPGAVAALAVAVALAAGACDRPVTPGEYGGRPDDGEDDTEALARSLEVAVKRGRPWVLPRGVWRLSATLHASGPVRMIGEGATRSILKNTRDSDHLHMLVLDRAKDALVGGIGFDGSFRERNATAEKPPVCRAILIHGPADSVVVERCRFTDVTEAVRIGGGRGLARGVTILENEIVAQRVRCADEAGRLFPTRGILATAIARDLRVEGNDVTGGAPDTLARVPAGTEAIGVAGEGLFVINNTVHDWAHGAGQRADGRSAPGGIGIFSDPSSRRVVIRGNRCARIGGDAISARGTDVVAADNVVTGGNDQGVVAEDADGFVIERNRISGTRTAGIGVQNARRGTVRANTVQAAGVKPLFASSPDLHPLWRSLVRVTNAPGDTTRDVRIVENVLIGRTGETAHGIFADGRGGVVDSVHVGDNRIEGVDVGVVVGDAGVSFGENAISATEPVRVGAR